MMKRRSLFKYLAAVIVAPIVPAIVPHAVGESVSAKVSAELAASALSAVNLSGGISSSTSDIVSEGWERSQRYAKEAFDKANEFLLELQRLSKESL